MMTVENILKKAILSSLDELGLDKIDFDLESSSDNRNRGDYAANVALLAFSLKKSQISARTPLELAKGMVGVLEKKLLGKGVVSRITAVSPGFINFYLSEEFYKRLLVEVISKGDDFGRRTIGRGKTVVIDYSAPNIAKPFGIGHLRSTIIGQALYNVFTFLGYRAIGDNHLGDWGTQFGALVRQIKLKVKSEKLKVEDLTIKDLEKLYVEFHQEAKKNPAVIKEAKRWFKKLEEGDKGIRKIWQELVDLSLVEYQRIYRLLRVKIDFILGESFYQDKMTSVIDRARRKKLVIESEGALIMPLENSPVPAMLIKSDGATTYLLRDLATIKYRVERWDPDLIIYEVGADHKLHFNQVFEAAEKLDYISREKLIHVAHGMIRGKFGEFSTREGKSLHLEKVLQEAIERAQDLSAKAGIGKDLSVQEQARVAKIVGIGAVKYNDLKQNPKTNIVFDWQKMLNLNGNSGPYLQYTYARAQRIMEKSGKELDLSKVPEYQPKSDELSVVRLICYFEGVVRESAQNFSPNLIANLLYQLAQNYNTFYSRRRVLIKEQKTKSFRLLLTAATAQVLKNGLRLLGIEAPERM